MICYSWLNLPTQIHTATIFTDAKIAPSGRFEIGLLIIEL
jgi:hypothetical protein